MKVDNRFTNDVAFKVNNLFFVYSGIYAVSLNRSEGMTGQHSVIPSLFCYIFLRTLMPMRLSIQSITKIFPLKN